MNKLVIHYDNSRFTKAQNEQIIHAHDYAEHAHHEQRRASGEPYFVHPLAVAETVAEWGLDAEAIMAALLHDVVEDTDTTVAEIEAEFGKTVAEMVDGLTKLSALPKPAAESSRLELSNENLRKLLLATAKDYRVILIKLADRLHNLRTLGFLPPSKRQRIALESLAVYAPLADRLGMGQLKSDLEDLAFRYAYPEEYAALLPLVTKSTKQSERYVTVLKHNLVELLEAGGVKAPQIEGRRKHLYSIYKKLAKVDGDLSKVYDLIAIRIIVADVAACYQALGVIHQRYKPLIYRIKDYIAVPKPNGYQSLHTTVFVEDGRITEIQIRTPEMHAEAERGLAAHFFYDAQKSSAAYKAGHSADRLPDRLDWVSKLTTFDEMGGAEETEASSRLELFADRIFVFSPKGDLYELPEHSTPVDFAFAIHSDIGLRALGAKVNGKLVTLDSELENRDVVEIQTRKEPSPNRDWLGFVKTAAARNKIRSWFRAMSRDANVATGRSELENELKVFGIKRVEAVPARQMKATLEGLGLREPDDLLAAIGDGSIAASNAVRRLLPDSSRPASMPVIKRVQATGKVLVEGSNLPYTLAPCCEAVFPQRIVGYVTRGKGVTIHRLTCPNLPLDSERYVIARWETLVDDVEWLVCRLQLSAANRVGSLSDITGFISRRGLNIGSIKSEIKSGSEGDSEVSFVLEVPDLFVLSEVMHGLGRLRGVTSVRRV
ncbi:bifunctional (p)ppGpp synthetase/guanosine-3',5'-bis(diphosphate) 3'-pyrophosphohydrolase [Candidatus Saccharibacteria bacterium]|nr:bifunctional (p)ppGpp synthetase/guanosine-3',5'-bis(diphosphate) 3'-pyrophosphohydrolase [Candidatus Saccharibacteria bacterium]